MFAKAERLKKSADFKHLARRGRSVTGQLLQIRFLPNGLDTCRFAFVTGLKISKKAAVRNKARRRLSEAVKKLAPLINKKFDFLFFAKAQIASKTQAEIINDVEKIFKKAGIYTT